MNDSPSQSLVSLIQNIIVETFEISDAEAETRAETFALLAEDKGGQAKAATLDWRYRVKKDLGDKLKWRSEAAHHEFIRLQKQGYESYEILISKPQRG